MTETTKDALQKMLQEWRKDNNYLTKVAREIVFNSDQSLENRYTGLMILLDDARNKKYKLEHGTQRMESYLNTLCDRALKEHKQKRIFEFTQKWAGKEVSEKMVEEMQSIEKPNHCYQFSGIKVVELDCNLCTSRKCRQGDKDYQPNQFENLLGGYTEEIPEGTHSVDITNQCTEESEVEDGTEE